MIVKPVKIERKNPEVIADQAKSVYKKLIVKSSSNRVWVSMKDFKRLSKGGGALKIGKIKIMPSEKVQEGWAMVQV